MAMKPFNRNKSEQVVGTPRYVIEGAEAFLGRKFDVDLACLESNKCAPIAVTPEIDSLAIEWPGAELACWCNPPFNRFPDFTRKARETYERTAGECCIVLLATASVDSNWWQENVHGFAVVRPIPRVRFVGAQSAFPRVLSLLFYGKQFGAPTYGARLDIRAPR